MVSLPEERILYQDIQKKLFYIIPEKWDSIYLYASLIDVPNQKPIGEMYFYYIPKSIIKKKPVNGYEIPNLFNIDEEQYSNLITNVFNSIKILREKYFAQKKKRFSNITISIENNKFKVEYGYEDLKKSDFDSYERHVIWRFKYLKEDINFLSRKDRKIIMNYNKYMEFRNPEKKDIYIEGIYKQPVKNIIDYEKTLSVEEAIAQSKKDNVENNKKSISSTLFKKNTKSNKKIDDVLELEDDNLEKEENPKKYTNQILNSGN